MTPDHAASAAPRRPVRENLAWIIWALIIALVLRIVVFQPYTIPSGSMQPTLRTGDYVLVSKWRYGWSRHSIPFSPPLPGGRLLGAQPRRGDIIVFKLPRDDRTDYVKRLIGLPGDEVRLEGGVVHVNGKPVARAPLGQGQDTDFPTRPMTRVRETLGSGRTYQTLVAEGQAPGRTTGVFKVPEGYYFFLGDNRDNSLDSRWPEAEGVGLVPAENLIGKVEFIAASWRPGAAIYKPWTWFTHLDPRRIARTAP